KLFAGLPGRSGRAAFAITTITIRPVSIIATITVRTILTTRSLANLGIRAADWLGGLFFLATVLARHRQGAMHDQVITTAIQTVRSAVALHGFVLDADLFDRRMGHAGDAVGRDAVVNDDIVLNDVIVIHRRAAIKTTGGRSGNAVVI